jgi:hypothetical protein
MVQSQLAQADGQADMNEVLKTASFRPAMMWLDYTGGVYTISI